MPIFEIEGKPTPDGGPIAWQAIRKIEETDFRKAGIRERDDLRRLLRAQSEIVVENTLIIAEELGDGEDTQPPIDLLGVDRHANLVIIGLKRLDEEGPLELQAIRSAALVSAMTFDQAVKTYTEHLWKVGSKLDARASLLDFLGWDEPQDEGFAHRVRIVLASADFPKKLLSAVLWLNGQGLDIRCVQLKPYAGNGRLLLDVQLLIPVPEATVCRTDVPLKGPKGKKNRAVPSNPTRRFWQGLLERSAAKTRLFVDKSPLDNGSLSANAGIPGVSFFYNILPNESGVGLYIDTPDKDYNKSIYKGLEKHRTEIDPKFDPHLLWQPNPAEHTSRIDYRIPGGLRSDEAEWPIIQDTLIDAMVMLERAFKPYLAKL